MIVVFRTYRKGMEKVIGKLEQALLAVLSESPGISGRELYEKILKHRKLAYTTVLTVLDRMVKKGVVAKKKVKRIYLYSPAMDREEFERRVTASVIQAAYEIAPSQAVSTFADILSRLDDPTRDGFLRMIEGKRRN